MKQLIQNFTNLSVPIARWTGFFMLLFFSMGVQACDTSKDEDRNTKLIENVDFNRIYLEGGFRVYLYHTPEPFVRIKGPTVNHIDAIDIVNNSDNLKLTVTRRQLNLSRVELHIGYSKLEELHISGGVRLTTDGFIPLSDTRIFVEGAINANMQVTAGHLEIINNGASTFDLSGVADRLTVRVSGAGHIRSRDLKTKEVVFRIEGMGFGSVNATEKLDVRIEGMGKVTYTGNPSVNRVVEGLGSVAAY